MGRPGVRARHLRMGQAEFEAVPGESGGRGRKFLEGGHLIPGGRRRALVLWPEVIARDPLHLVFRSEDDGHPLVELCGLEVQDPGAPIGGRATGLFHQQGHGIGFIHETQFSPLGAAFFVDGVHEDAAPGENTMNVRHHGSHPAHVEILAPGAVLAGLQFLDVTLDRGFPMAGIGGIDREFLGIGRNAHVRVGVDEAPHFAIEGEAVYAPPDGEDQLGGGAIQGVPGGDLGSARLQEIGLLRERAIPRAFQDGKDGANGNVDVDVGRAVQRIEEKKKAAFGIVRGNRLDGVHLFRGHGGQMPAPFVRLNENFVGDDVELLLGLTLDVVGAGFSEHPREGAFGNIDADGLDGPGDYFDEQAQVRRDQAGTLLLDQKLGEGDTAHSGRSQQSYKS